MDQAPGWPAGSHATVPKTPLPVPPAVLESTATHPPPTTPAGILAGRAIAAAAARLVAAKDELDAADALVGDGDCGSTLALGAAAMQEDMAAGRYPLDDAVGLCAALGRSCRAMGGSSGALYEIFFTAAAGRLGFVVICMLVRMLLLPQYLGWEASTVNALLSTGPLASSNGDVAEIAAAMAAGVAAMCHHGGAKRGCRTMIDALVPAVEALHAAAEQGADGMLVAGATRGLRCWRGGGGGGGGACGGRGCCCDQGVAVLLELCTTRMPTGDGGGRWAQ